MSLAAVDRDTFSEGFVSPTHFGYFFVPVPATWKLNPKGIRFWCTPASLPEREAAGAFSVN